MSINKKPINMPLDQLTQPEIDNGTIASYQLLAEIDQKQHSLATGFYGAPVWYYLGGASNDYAHCHYNVPPMITKCGLVVFAAGNGRITVTVEDEAGSAIDSTGSIIDDIDTGTDNDGPEKALPFAISNTVPGATAAEGRVLTVSSGAGWVWDTCVIKIISTSDLKIYGCTIVPIHVIA